ncbi:MAG TPA: FtsK/SpoIIIE domain-containing protein [Gaiellaceae bacterium]|nr:FtsK/SpoIIIE domain-containing protein [Gaiellaceae bacterium]
MDSTPLQLRLVVRGPDGGARDVELDAYAETPAQAVGDALAAELGLNGDTLVSPRTGRALRGDDPLARIGLVDGDELVAGGEPAAEPAAVALELAVGGGAAAGRRLALPPGEHRVGRASQCALALDDRALSGEHLVVRVDERGSVEVEDLGSSNGTTVEGVSLEPGSPRQLEPGEVVQAGRTLLELESRVARAPAAAPAPDGTVPFNRPPRVQTPVEQAVRPFPAPPAEPYRSRLPLAASLVPLVLGVALYAITGYPTMLLFAALSPVMALASFVEERRTGRSGYSRGTREYRRRLAALREELEQERAREVRRRRAVAPSAAELLRRVQNREPGLWERRADDADFLSLRLGSAERPASLALRLEPGGSDDLRREVEQLAEWYATVPCVPVAAPLVDLGVLGLCGPAGRVGALGRWLAAQAAALHSPRELVIAAALAPERQAEWEWLKWLPHARAETAPIEPLLASGREGSRELLEAIAELVRARRAESESVYGGAAQRPLPAVLLVVDEAVAPDRALVAEALGRASDAGVAAVWLGRERRDLPGESRGIVELDDGLSRLAYTDARTGETSADVTADGLAPELALRLALALAPVRDTSAVGPGASVPERATLLGLLGIDEPDARWIADRWGSETPGRIALLGAAAGEPFAVDLRVDGPHALVAGITGAGKSELLQTMIASLAAAYPPTRLTFLLVDYKGGAAFKDCVALPHTVGYVTDLDGHLARRALVSLNAELRRRERLLSDAGAKDLAELEERDRDTAPPSLAIVIDEFATLAREIPEFVEGVVDVAQRGRSLGVHLVLATQRPSGVVSDNIRANTNLRIALRVNEAAESTDVIGTPDAARIPRDRPGRAFARTGHGELTEFQAAYAGGATVIRSRERAVVVRELRFEGAPVALGDGRAAGESDLARLVAAAVQAADEAGLAAPVRPWLPPLESMLPLADLERAEGDDATAAIAVGVIDEPALQRRRPLVIDFESDGSVLVYGASGAGKTTLLRTMALALAQSAPPEELHLYGLDFATRGLLALKDLPHCGAVIAGEDEERVARLFGMLRRALERRKHLFAQSGVFTLSEYRRKGGGEPVPRILVLLDGYAGFVSAFERVNLGQLVEILPRLVGDGRPLGVHFAITADRRGAVPSSLAGLIPAKLILRLADDDELAAFGIPTKTVRGSQLPPGRGFLPNALELQIALLGDDASGEGQASALAAAAEELRRRHPDASVPPVEPLPTSVERSALQRSEEPLTVVLGLGDAELEPLHVSLADRHFLVAGPYRSGRSTALATVVAGLRESSPELPIHLLAPRRSPLVELEGWTSAATGMEECDAAAARLAELEGPAALVIDDGDELAESLGAASLETLVRRGRDAGICIIAAAERQAVQRAFAGWLRELRKDEHGLLLDPDPDVDGDLLGARLPRRSNPVFPPGRGYYVDRGLVELVQVASAAQART